MKKLGGCLSILGAIFAVLIVLGFVVGGSGGSKQDFVSTGEKQEATTTEAEATTQQEAEPEPQAKYVISDEEAVVDEFSYKITGILTNNSGRDCSYVQVEYNLYDADGNQIGTALANINNLKDGGTWKFEAFAFTSPESIASFELADVTGF